MRTIAVLLAVAASTGCDTTLSSNLGNDELRLSAFAEIDDTGEVDVVAVVTTDNEALLEETYVDLGPGDRLIVHLADETIEMSREWVYVLNLVQYRAHLANRDTSAPTPLRIDLERDGDDDVLGSEVVIPPAFELVTVPDRFSRSQPLALEWEEVPADDSYLDLSGPCLDARFDMVGNPGAIEIAPTRLQVPEGTVASATCSLTATVAVSNTTAAADGFGRGGILRATQSRTTTMQSTP